MPHVGVTRRYRFSASHRLHTPRFDEARNSEVYGKCNNPYGHGHDYLLEVTIAGEPDAASGRLMPLRDLDQFVERVILETMGHRNLNTEVAEFADRVPTTENLVVVVAARLNAAWAKLFTTSAARLHKVRIHETKRNIFEVRVDPAQPSE